MSSRPTSDMPIAGFDQFVFEHANASYTVYTRGAKGPGVLIMHEVFGVSNAVIRFAAILSDAGFHVWVPRLFGKPRSKLSGLVGLGRACIRREFHLFAMNHSSPVVQPMRAMVRSLHAARKGPGIGVVGLCLTGNFALSLLIEPAVVAPIAAEPSLPLRVPFFPSSRFALHLSPEEEEAVRRRAGEGTDILAFRFTRDWICPYDRLMAIQALVPSGRFRGEQIDSREAKDVLTPYCAHSVLTEHFEDKEGHPTRNAVNEVITFLRAKLQ